jgi:hypothetical protein
VTPVGPSGPTTLTLDPAQLAAILAAIERLGVAFIVGHLPHTSHSPEPTARRARLLEGAGVMEMFPSTFDQLPDAAVLELLRETEVAAATSVLPIRVSRSAIADRQLCEQRRWWGYHAGDGGYAPVVEPTSLQVGNLVHELMALVFRWATAHDTDGCRALLRAWATERWLDPSDEQLLAFALASAWTRLRLPDLLEEYEIVAVEEEWAWALASDITIPLRMDVILRRKADGLLVTIDFKTQTSWSPDWQAKFEHDLQTLLYTAALEDVMGEVGGIQYEGMIKGRRDLLKTGEDAGEYAYGSILVSPYWDPKAYSKGEAVGSLTGVYKAGLTRRKLRTIEQITTWQDWLALNQPEVLANQFPSVPLFMPSRAMRDSVFEGVIRKEREFARLLPMATATTYERNPSACLKFGSDYPCPHRELCWGGGAEDPLGTGLYVPRIDHHAEEEA